MATEEASSNLPGAVAAQRPLEGLFPVRRVLDLLQRTERLSEQLSPVTPPKERDEHQENQDANRQSEEVVAESPPSQPDEGMQEFSPEKGEEAALSCPKCGKGFSSGTSLRTHLANVYPCDQPRPVILPREGRLESKSCFKCGKTFASWQGLRGHLNRIKPCDQEKPATPTIRRRPAVSRTCTKCGKTFSSPQSLRIHMNRVKPCDQDKKTVSAPTTPPATTPPTTPFMMNTEDLKKEAERKAKARYQARKAYLKKRGRLDELGDPPSSFYQSGDDHKDTPKPDLKRNAPDEPCQEGGNSEASNAEAKKPRIQDEPSQDDGLADSPSDVSGLTAQPNAPPHTQPEPARKVVPSEGSFVQRSNNDHGGDLLAGGCSCPLCVRRWARKLMNRMQQLEDEVVTLRQKKSTGVDSAKAAGAGSTNTPTPTSHVDSDKPTGSQPVELSRTSNVGAASLSPAKPVDIFRSLTSSSNVVATSIRPDGAVSGSLGKIYPNILSRTDGPSQTRRDDLSRADGEQQQQQSPTASVYRGSDKKSLVDAYSHMNDQILINEKTVEESSGHAQILVGYNPDFRRQVDELRAAIIAEKSKRDVVVATLIAHEWRPRRDEFRAILERTGPQHSSNEEQDCHAKWADISNQVTLKDEVMAELERRMDSLGQSGGSSRSRYAEMGELSSKMAAEYAAKMALESERESVYPGLVMSSTRIRSLVRNALL
ncbi:hypothetical protein PHYPSEUDO_005651 [Phytophthora pseudosyringae]|uniref:C2H2-type domain-containing protein n=1 Tax=Phytophthora pseudosyringae TaxID=221518 RepID=A0A8T1VNM3_9STRA|nr:hypothetical protein PHYPSEUDO_005651 [Phytophthora pseudosyringae]